MYAADRHEIARAIGLLGDREHAMELRWFPAGRRSPLSLVARLGQPTTDQSGYESLVRRACEAASTSTVFYLLNPVSLSHVGSRAASDKHIVTRRWLLVDVDAVRPTDTSSTDAEHQDALSLAGKIRDWLTARGWPLPVEIDSGNGAHLLYRIDLHNDDGSKALVNQILQAISAEHSTDTAKVDTAVGNASRPAKLPGTWAFKGEDTPDRPHRMCRLLSVPEPVEIVPHDRLLAIAALAPAPAPKRKTAKPRRTGSKGDPNRYAQAALLREVVKLASTPPGDRNNQLFRSTAALGNLVAGGVLPAEDVEAAMEGAALTCGLVQPDIGRTIASAMATGMQTPRSVPDMEQDASTPQVPAAEPVPEDDQAEGPDDAPDPPPDAGDDPPGPAPDTGSESAPESEPGDSEFDELQRLIEEMDSTDLLQTLLDPARLASLARLYNADRPELERTLATIRKRLTARDEQVLRQSIKAEAKKQASEARQQRRQEAAQQAQQRPACSLSNYREEEERGDGNGEECEIVRVGLSALAIRTAMSRLTDRWPRRVGELLFVEGTGPSVCWLESAPKLFGYLQSRIIHPSGDNPISWARGTGMISKEEFHAYLSQTAHQYAGVEEYPRWPEYADHYYLQRRLEGGDGSHLRGLLNLFSPATDVDWYLLEAYLMTLVWGGRPGSRPAFLFTGEDDDPKGGRGIGKSKTAELGASVVGGHVSCEQDADIETIKTRLLSPTGLTKRVLLLDNLKSLRFSWGALESIITTPVISGRQMYVGEGQRPNTITVALTLNGASLSKDMAQRCIIVKLARPTYSPHWDDEINHYIEQYRWKILGDIVARLKQPAIPIQPLTRWGLWEREILGRSLDPVNCQTVIVERQGEVDDDTHEADAVREHIYHAIRSFGLNPDSDAVWISSKRAAEFINEALGERHERAKACSKLARLTIPELRRPPKYKGSRGFVWTGIEPTLDRVSEDYRYLSREPVDRPIKDPWVAKTKDEDVF